MFIFYEFLDCTRSEILQFALTLTFGWNFEDTFHMKKISNISNKIPCKMVFSIKFFFAANKSFHISSSWSFQNLHWISIYSQFTAVNYIQIHLYRWKNIFEFIKESFLFNTFIIYNSNFHCFACATIIHSALHSWFHFHDFCLILPTQTVKLIPIIHFVISAIDLKFVWKVANSIAKSNLVENKMIH